MAMTIYQELKARGYFAQVTHEKPVEDLLSGPPCSFYIGFDPTADSLHIGHFVTMMLMAHLQRAGHRPIALMGGGTGFVGDPSGRSDLRQILSPEQIAHNVANFKRQMGLVLDFSEGNALLLNNADWILPLNYIDFLRDIGPHFSVNRMLGAECYKMRMATGLSFLEFNYMILQAYDFLHLYRHHGCRLQIGGDDQWSNIIAGSDLIRRKEQGEAYGLTLSLLTNADGSKMGKTVKGALFLDEARCSVYDFYQYFRNVADADVLSFMKRLTFMSLDEIDAYASLEGAALNAAKKRLAFEVTCIVHGEAKAKEAEASAEAIFSGAGLAEQMPGATLGPEVFESSLLDCLVHVQFLSSKSEGRRLIQQKGLRLNDEPVEDPFYQLREEDFHDGSLVVRRGKKHYFKISFKR